MTDEPWRLQVSPKLADGTLINLRAETADELDHLLDSLDQGLTAKIAGTIGLLQAAGNVAGIAAPAAQQPTRQGPPPRGNRPGPAQQQGGGEDITVCTHGQRVHRTGTSSKGPWEAWFCPAPKGPGQCQANFV